MENTLVQAPAGTGSVFSNYKGTFSIALLAIVDANYRFILVDIRSYGSHSESAIFNNTKFCDEPKNGKKNIYPTFTHPGDGDGDDEALPLRHDLL